MAVPYRRVLIKLSGEILRGEKPFGIDQEACKQIAFSLKAIHAAGIEVGVVIGGGNIFRGVRLESLGLERTPADYMGMLATLINGIALQQSLLAISCPCKLMSGLECPKAIETYHWMRAQEYLTLGNVLVFVGGTGNPFFTTDSAAALRACEIKADILLKATKVDGVYDKDPMLFPDAVKYEALTYSQALANDLKVMDASSVAICRANQIPILVFNMAELKNDHFVQELTRKNIGTLVKGEHT